ncbi:MAG: hypothetical protein WD826_11820 [Actinomycetota bacterium]
MRKAVAIAFIAVGLALVVALLLAPNSDIVRLPTPTEGTNIVPTPTEATDPSVPRPKPLKPKPGDDDETTAPTYDPVGDHDCGPECYEEHKPPRATQDA